MPLWGNQQVANGVFKPKFGFPKYMGIPNISPGANGANTFGVTAAGAVDPAGTFAGNPPVHAGWVNIVLGRGYLDGVIEVLAAGNNIVNLSYHSANITGGNGSGANVQVTSVNGNGAVGNVLTVTVRAGGSNYNGAVNIAIVPAMTAASGNAYVRPRMSTRVGQFKTETIVAMGSITGTDPVANNWFANNA